MANSNAEGQCISSDILFPEDSPQEKEVREEFDRFPTSQTIYSPPSNYSTYSQEIKYFLNDHSAIGSGKDTKSSPRYVTQYKQSTPLGNVQKTRLQSVDGLGPVSEVQSTPRQSVSSYQSTRSNQSYHSNNSHQSTGSQPQFEVAPTRSNHLQSHRDLKHVQPKINYRHNSLSCVTGNGNPNRQQNHVKRRTWSPQHLSTMGVASSFQGNGYKLRSYHSNDQLDMDNTGHLYEDLNFVTMMAQPPKIAPVSGILGNDQGKCLVRPIAFKPVVTQNRYVNPSNQQQQHDRQHQEHTAPPGENNNKYPMNNKREDFIDDSMILNVKSSPKLQHLLIKDGGSGSRQSSNDEGYISQDYQSSNISRGSQNSNQGSYHSSAALNSHAESMLDTKTAQNPSGHRYKERRASFNGENCLTVTNDKNLRPLPDRPESLNSSSIGRVSSNRIEEFTVEQTPSPSDSGVGEMEMIMREKDTEIINLRETMDHNEKVIFQVYEEKQQCWEMELAEVKEEYQHKIRSFQGHMNKMEQSFMLQIYKLQQEKKNLESDCEKERNTRMAAEGKLKVADSKLHEIMSMQDESKWRVHHKAGEVGLLKQQAKDAKEELGMKTNEVMTLRSQVRDLQGQVGESNEKVAKLQHDLNEARIGLHKVQSEVTDLKTKQALVATGNNNNYAVIHHTANTGCQVNTLGSLQSVNDTTELDQAKKEIAGLHQQMEDEKQRWFQEKDKVVRYQKQLQLNYVQMFRKSRMLESEIEQLTMELEGRDLKLITAPDESLC